ncbi:transposase [Rhodocytophaga aerolata]|uniref:Transposase n=1 Tax=Rhodocytophaga aerolata TaxID=455078 RepID=A0ABT8RHR4_9BACT|nr:transposase [Rhodocytophaga aerolata]MDO1451641.1 transposase [Rhodocytophaga aerolata]
MVYVVVHRADIDERRAAGFLLNRLLKKKLTFPRLSVIFADGGYRGEFEAFVRKTFRWFLQIVQKPLGVKTFQVLPKRWIVERTFSWLTAHRRLSVDYERKVKSSEAMFHIAMI